MPPTKSLAAAYARLIGVRPLLTRVKHQQILSLRISENGTAIVYYIIKNIAAVVHAEMRHDQWSEVLLDPENENTMSYEVYQNLNAVSQCRANKKKSRRSDIPA